MPQPTPRKQAARRASAWRPSVDELQRLLAEVRPVIAELARKQRPRDGRG